MSQFPLKIYVNDRPLILCDYSHPLQIEEGTFYYQYDNPETLKTVFELVENNDSVQRSYFSSQDVDQLTDVFLKNFKIIHAAGGLVLNEQDEILWINRWNKWDLPKGKIEKNEEIPVAALREVEEETGIAGLAITKPLNNTYHTYRQNDKLILKITYWFEMKCIASGKKLVPQHEEGITEAVWKTKIQTKEALGNTYKTIEELVRNSYSF